MKTEQETITGEQVEQTLEEKVREILEPLGLAVAYVHDDEVSVCNKLHQFWITSTHIRWASEEKTIEEYHDFDGYYRDEFEHVSKLLTAQPESEQTLEEAVGGWLEDVDNDWFEIKPDHVLVHFSSRTDRIDCDHVSDSDRNCKWHVSTLDHSRYVANYVKAIRNIAAALSTRSTKPSYSELEIKYEGRLKELRQVQEDYKRERERADKLERENASLLDKFGPIDQAEQQYAVARKEFETFTEKVGRWAQGIIELNEEIL